MFHGLGDSVEGVKLLCKDRWGNISTCESTKKGKTCAFPSLLLLKSNTCVFSLFHHQLARGTDAINHEGV